MLDEAVVGRGGKNILKCFVDTDLILNRAKSLQISLSGYPLDPKVTGRFISLTISPPSSRCYPGRQLFQCEPKTSLLTLQASVRLHMLLFLADQSALVLHLTVSLIALRFSCMHIPMSEGWNKSSGLANRSFPIQSTCSSSSGFRLSLTSPVPSVCSGGAALGPDRI